MNFTKPPYRNILIISPHADDEVIGCGGMIALASNTGISTNIIVMATGGVQHCHLNEMSPTKTRVSELETCASQLGVSCTKVLFPGKDMQLEMIPSLELVTALDKALNEYEYDECYIPEPSHNLAGC